MKNLTLLQNHDFGVTALDGIPVVCSRRVAERFDKEHKDVLRAIEKHLAVAKKDFSGLVAQFCAANFKESFYRDRGKRYPEYLLTKDGFTFVVMGFTGPKAAFFKVSYINRFNEMECFIKSRNIARLEYPELTNAIKTIHEDPKFYHYSTEADMINRIVMGMSAKQFRQKHGLDKGDSIRGHLTHQQAEAIQKLQRFDVGLVAIYPNFQDRKRALQAYFGKMRESGQSITKTGEATG